MNSRLGKWLTLGLFLVVAGVLAAITWVAVSHDAGEHFR
jgi:hypothetical protein